MNKPAPKGDTTQTRRATRRRKTLNEIAQAAGYESWSAFETAVINGKSKIPQNKNASPSAG